ncbi:carboxypeptidase regulatory-like domain-containing protein [Nitrospirales bacterium NOB]|nr:carboxypeptidase regulatory-like domain-containing protein [Nitrospirales bacterium NOB]
MGRCMAGGYSRGDESGEHMSIRGCSLLLYLVGATCIGAQTIDTGILGTVSDSAGGRMAGAVVTITQPQTGLTRTIQTDASGQFEIRYLVPGEYTVEVMAAGFQKARRAGIQRILRLEMNHGLGGQFRFGQRRGRHGFRRSGVFFFLGRGEFGHVRSDLGKPLSQLALVEHAGVGRNILLFRRALEFDRRVIEH